MNARRWLVPVLFALLVGLRVPSLAQPASGDQGLYAYVGQRILHGELPYRDAWDQKPPAVHFAYALMQAAWPDLHVVNVADLVLTVATAATLLALGPAFGVRGGGATAALLFLFLANPIFGRLGGVRVRGQSEIFIGALVAFAVFAATRSVSDRYRVRPAWALISGVCVGLAATFKYPAAIYGLPALVALATDTERRSHRDAVIALFAGAALPVLGMVLVFAAGGALADLYHATYTYNVFYSGETYAGPADFFGYLLTFPVKHAWLDSLWWLGGLGSAVLLALSIATPRYLVVPAWIAAACVAIAVNGSRGLPQYFVQAWPALALAAGLMLALAWQRISLVPRLVLVALVATGIWRVTTIPKAVDYWRHDVAYLAGTITRDAYLSRFGERASGDKYSALAIDELSSYLRDNSAPTDRVLVFGFSPGALVEARRASATRFFWSRPVIVGFKSADERYGVQGMLGELERHQPSLVVLQRHDWDPDGPDSWTFFMNEPRLAGWLTRHYVQATELGNFVIWRRTS